MAGGRAQAEFENSRDYKPEAKDWLSSYWAGFNSPNQIARIRNTGVPMNFLKEARSHLLLKPLSYTKALPDPAQAPEPLPGICASLAIVHCRECLGSTAQHASH